MADGSRSRRPCRATPHTHSLHRLPCPALPCSPPPNSLQASDIEKGQLADSAAALSERCMGLEEQLKTARHSLLSLRAVADQGRGDLQAQLQRKESDMGRLQLAGEAQAALVDELKCQVDKHAQEREHLAMQAQQLSAQLAKAGEASKADNLRMAQLAAALEEKTLALEAAEVGGRVGGEAGAALIQAVVPVLRVFQLAAEWPHSFSVCMCAS